MIIKNNYTSDNLLTAHETRILIALCEGKLYKEVANEFAISINTIKGHAKKIYGKMSVRNRTEACNKFRLMYPDALEKAC